MNPGDDKAAQQQADIARELDFHLEMRVRELVAQGMSESDARAAAERRFGSYQASMRECLAIDDRREDRMQRAQYWGELRQDLGYAFRMHRRTPGFTAVALVTLALAIGATSAIFSVVHGVLLSALPFRDADRLYRVTTLYPDGTPYSLSAPDFASLRQDTRALERVEAYAASSIALVGAGEPREVAGVSVTDGLFDLLGLTVAAGTPFHRDHHQPGRGSVVLLDHGFWTRAFGGESVIGRTLTLGGSSYTVLGVMAPGARLPGAADVYTPVTYDNTFQPTDQPARRSEFLTVIAKARPGQDEAAVQSDLARLGTAMQQAFPATNGRLTFSAATLRSTIVGDVERPLWMLMGAVAFVLLVACANIASLLLARASARQQEISMRVALGAGRRRLVRQLVTESVLLSLAGGALGLGLAWAGTRALLAARPADIPRLDQIGLDPVVVLVTLGVSVATGLLFGLFPAVQATRRSLTAGLREGGRSGAGGRASNRVRAGLVVAEMALAVMLLMGAGLLIRSFVELTNVPRGFDTDRAMAFTAMLQGPKYGNATQIRARIADVEARLEAMSGVTAAAASTIVPLTNRGSVVDFAVAGAPPPPANVNAEIAMASITPDFFRAIGTPLKSGRMFTDRDTAEAPLVALINEAGVRLWFSGQDPLNKVVNAAGRPREIVGVVGDIRQRGLRNPALPQLFVPYPQRVTRTPRFIIRAAQDPMLLAPAIRAMFREIDPDVALTPFVPFTQLVDDSVARPRFYTSLLVLFAGTALVLAAVGIFGVMSYTVAQRSREISIRLALGARRREVVSMVVGRALALSALGIGLGLAGTYALVRVIQGLLFGVRPLDPLTVAAVTIVLGGSALLASFLPARRAATIDPGGVLRQ
jgi:putative ABC transport system permease protein